MATSFAMRFLFPLCLLVLLAFSSVGAAQTNAQTEASEMAAPADPIDTPSSIQIDPQTGERFRQTRPEEPLRRGQISVAPWVVYAVGGCVVLLALALLARRTRSATRSDPS